MTAPGDRAKLDALGDTQAATDEETRPPTDAPPRRPEPSGLPRVGRFSILTRLGAGAMGVVFAAYDEILDRKVAIKLLKGGAGDPDRKARLIREAQALARLSHPNVVAIHESGEHDQQIYIAMEFVRGRTLDDALLALGEDARARPWKAVVDLVLAAGRGLAAAHGAGLVHRDFKPQNVLVGDDGVVKVADFGLARAAIAELEAPTATDDAGASLLESPLTRVGALVGTPAYMAPEQLEGGLVSPKSDQFAFCVALFEALSGERPYRGDSLAALLDALAAGLPAGERRLGGPAWLEAALRRGLARDPEARWPTMDALLDALDADARARDSDEQRSQLRRVLLTLGPTPLLVWAAVVVFPVAEGGVYTPTIVLAIWVGMVALLAALLAMWWRAAFRPGTNRTVSTLMLATLACNGANRVYGVVRDLDVADILAHDLLLFATVFAGAGLFLSRWFVLAMLVPLLAIVAIVLAPAAATDIFSTASVALVPLLYLCIRQARAQPKALPR